MNLLPGEAAWLDTHPERCEECQHLAVFHDNEEGGCALDDCRCDRDGRPIERCQKCGDEAMGSPKDCWRCCPRGPCKKCGKAGEHERFLCFDCRHGIFADVMRGCAEEAKEQLNRQTFAVVTFMGKGPIRYVTPTHDPRKTPEGRRLQALMDADDEAMNGIHERALPKPNR